MHAYRKTIYQRYDLSTILLIKVDKSCIVTGK